MARFDVGDSGVSGAFDEKERVFDLSVDGAHEYFAGGVLVHND